MTRGLHLDGLADWADGFSGGRDRDDTLAIMKDPQVGTFGVLAVTLVLLLKYIAILRMVSVGSLHWIVPAYVVSRTVMVELSVWLPYARPEGGTAGPFVNNARTRHRLLAPALAVILLLAFSGWAGLVLLAAGFTVCRFLGIWFHRRVGGVTGDLLGACCEIVETGLLFSCATAGHMPSPYTSWRLLPL
jgi:adenosylcobinamide-GDP ribazoletransferase